MLWLLLRVPLLIAALAGTVAAMRAMSDALPQTGVVAYAAYAPREVFPDIFLLDLRTLRAINVTRHPNADVQPDWSPDGTRLTFVSDRDTVSNVYIIDVATRVTQRLTTGVADALTPDWSPSGDAIVFLEDAGAWFDLGLADARTGEARLLNRPAGYGNFGWSLDGQQIVFTTNTLRMSGVYALDLAANTVTVLSQAGNVNAMPAWSPDGTRLAFTSDRDGTMDVWMLTPDDGTERNLTGSDEYDYAPAWSPDGRRIAFFANENGAQRLMVLDVESGELRAIADGQRGSLHPTWLPNGQQVLFLSQGDRFTNGLDLYMTDMDGHVRQITTGGRLVPSSGFALRP